MQTRILLLGPARAVGPTAVELAPDRRLALLAYLALAREWVERGRLAFVLWPDTHEAQARENLRQLLTRVRRFPFTADLESERERLRWIIPF